MNRSRRSVVSGITATVALAGCGANREKEGTIVGRIPDPTLPWDSPQMENAQRDLPPPMRSADARDYDLALSPDGTLIAAALPFAPTNEVLIIDVASRRGWRLQHPHRRVLITNPSFLPNGQLALLVTPPPMYFGVSEIWINDVNGSASACISGHTPYLYRKPHFSLDSAKCLTFREANQAEPRPPGSPRREYREPSPVSLFEIDIGTGNEHRLSERAFERGQAFYAPAQAGYFLSTSPPLIAGAPPWPGGPVPYRSPSFSSIDSDEAYPFNGFFVAANDEIGDRPTGIIPAALYQLDETPGSHARLEDADHTGQLLISYQHRRDDAAFGICVSAAIVSEGDVRRQIELGGPRLETPRISADGRTIAGFVGARRKDGVDVTLSSDDRPLLFVIERDGERSLLSVSDIRIDEAPRVLEPSANAEIV